MKDVCGLGFSIGIHVASPHHSRLIHYLHETQLCVYIYIYIMYMYMYMYIYIDIQRYTHAHIYIYIYICICIYIYICVCVAALAPSRNTASQNTQGPESWYAKPSQKKAFSKSPEHKGLGFRV